MKYSIWKICDRNDNELGLIATETFLDIMDVALRGKNKYGLDDTTLPRYIGEVEIV